MNSYSQQSITVTNSHFSVKLDDGSEKTVRVFGTHSDPHFSGKDICDIMDIKDSKDVLFSTVKETHKTNLKKLLEDLNNAPKQPSWLVGLNPPDSLGSTNLSTLSYHEGRLVVLSEPGVYDLLNGSKKHKNKKVLKEAFDRVMYALKYENSVGLVDIFSFASKMQIALDIESEWFKDLWYPLSRANPPHMGGVGRVSNRPLIVTQSLLDWMGFQGRDLSDKQEKFSRVLKRNEIQYVEIGCDDPLAIEYPSVQTEMKLIPKQVEQKKWICLDMRDFKKAVMRLHTDNGDLVREYYLNLEELMFDYAEYTKMYLVAQREKEVSHMMHQLAIKDDQLAIKERSEEELKREQEELRQELEDVEKIGVKTRNMLEKEREAREEAEKQKKIAELRAVTLTRLNVAFQERAKTQIFYIVTSKVMAKDNEFKIGGVENHSLLKKRLSMYNTGNSGVHSELTMFFVYFAEVANYKQMEMRVKELIHPFRSKRNANSENFNLHFNILKPVVEMVSENYNEEIDKLNGFVQALLETHTSEYVEPVEVEAIDPDCVPDRLDVQLTVTRRGFGTTYTQKAKISELDDSQLKEVVSRVIETLGTVRVIKRKDIERVLADSFVIQSNLRRIWDVSKTLIEESGKTPKY
jgi:prophage antirepressor-like protein